MVQNQGGASHLRSPVLGVTHNSLLLELHTTPSSWSYTQFPPPGIKHNSLLLDLCYFSQKVDILSRNLSFLKKKSLFAAGLVGTSRPSLELHKIPSSWISAPSPQKLKFPIIRAPRGSQQVLSTIPVIPSAKGRTNHWNYGHSPLELPTFPRKLGNKAAFRDAGSGFGVISTGQGEEFPLPPTSVSYREIQRILVIPEGVKKMD